MVIGQLLICFLIRYFQAMRFNLIFKTIRFVGVGLVPAQSGERR